MSSLAKLHQKALIIIFAYAPAGLGHLRVTDALYAGLPKTTLPLLMGSHDKWITYIHRVMSIHPITRSIFEWMQKGLAERVFTYIYRSFLRLNTDSIYEQLETIIDQRIDQPKTVLVIATHFGLAHQLAAVKKRLMKERDIRLILVVQVTDDSPQYIWYVQGADIICVPSERTRDALITYGRKSGLPKTTWLVNPYPINPKLRDHLQDQEFEKRKHQLDPLSNAKIHIAIPVSGAAVGTDFTSELIGNLYLYIPRVFFHVITKTVPYTQNFLQRIERHAYVKTYTATSDRGAVNEYEFVYMFQTISLELTKPSEQAFKALLTPFQQGGSLLLFSHPVGRQEYDNLEFLRSHSLIPTYAQQQHLWKLARNNVSILSNKNLKSVARTWRGVILPNDPYEASQFIAWCLQQELFYIMVSRYTCTEDKSLELRSDGVELFWEKVSQLL